MLHLRECIEIRLRASRFVQYFLKRPLAFLNDYPIVSNLVNRMSIELIAIYFHSFEIFNIQIGDEAFCQPDFIIIKSNYFQNAQKAQCFLDDFEALVREIYVRG
jgi:hypothetical protein